MSEPFCYMLIAISCYAIPFALAFYAMGVAKLGLLNTIVGWSLLSGLSSYYLWPKFEKSRVICNFYGMFYEEGTNDETRTGGQ